MYRTYVIYHAACMDGFGAAFAIWKHLGDHPVYIPCSYGDPVPDIEDNSVVYIVDFSFKRQELLDLNKRVMELKVLDHHMPKKKDIGDLPFVTFSENESGAVMTWKHFSTEPVPLMLLYIQDWDLWEFELSDSKEINAYYRSMEMDFRVWDYLMYETKDDIGPIRQGGEAILRSVDKIVDMICKQARFEELGGHEVPVVNATSHWSEVGHRLLELYPDAPFSACYFDLKNGDIKWSLRGRPGGVDVSEVAAQFGGGGHKQAAGFVW